RAWKSATRAKALDLVRGLLPAGALTNLGLLANSRAIEYMITKMAAHELPECRRLATDLHHELSLVIPAFVRRALDDKYGMPAAERIKQARDRVARQTPSLLAGEGRGGGLRPSVSLVDFDPEAERKVVAAALFPHSNAPLAEQSGDPAAVLDALLADRANRREIYHLCELRTTPQGHPDYRWVAQEMFRRVAEVHPRLAAYARFVDLGPGDELERRKSERRIDAKLSAINRPVR